MGKGALVYISLGPQYAALGTFSAWFFVVFQAFRCFSSCVYGGCCSDRQFRSCLQGVDGVGKGALVYISLGPQYAALGTFSAWFFVVFQAVSMVVAVAESAVSQLSPGR